MSCTPTLHQWTDRNQDHEIIDGTLCHCGRVPWYDLWSAHKQGSTEYGVYTAEKGAGGEVVQMAVFFMDKAKAEKYAKGRVDYWRAQATDGALAIKERMVGSWDDVSSYRHGTEMPARPNDELRYTTAPTAYDGFSTITVDPDTGHYNRGDHGKAYHQATPYRKIALQTVDLTWQSARYASGMYPCWTQEQFDAMIRDGLIIPRFSAPQAVER
jgi:hypothetical protein